MTHEKAPLHPPISTLSSDDRHRAADVVEDEGDVDAVEVGQFFEEDSIADGIKSQVDQRVGGQRPVAGNGRVEQSLEEMSVEFREKREDGLFRRRRGAGSVVERIRG